MYAFRTIFGGTFILFPLTGLVSFYFLKLLSGYQVDEPPIEYIDITGEYIVAIFYYVLFMIPGFFYSLIMAMISPQFVTEKMKKATPKLIFKYSLIGMCAGGGPYFIFYIFLFIGFFIYEPFPLTVESFKGSIELFLILLSFFIAGMVSSLPILKIWVEYRDAEESKVY